MGRAGWDRWGFLFICCRCLIRRRSEANVVAKGCVDLLCRCQAIKKQKTVELVPVSFHSTAVVRFQRGHQWGKKWSDETNVCRITFIFGHLMKFKSLILASLIPIRNCEHKEGKLWKAPLEVQFTVGEGRPLPLLLFEKWMSMELWKQRLKRWLQFSPQLL